MGIVAAALIVVVVVATAVVRARRPSGRPRPAVPTGVPVPAAAPGPLGSVVGFLRRHRWVRRAISAVSVAIMVVALGIIGYPFYTNLLQSRIQARLHRQLASPELHQAYVEHRIEVGDSLTRIQIPRIGVDVVVVEGTTTTALRAGAGHYVNSPLPCEKGNVAIAGHRTTYGRPFNNLDLLTVGDEVILETPVGKCTYVVTQAPFVVEPTRTSVIANTPEAILTLTTCHPKGSARQRLILKAALVSSEIAPA
jgi:sortase A